YERMITRRYLMPGKGEGFIFLVAGISLVAVALGVAALIAVMSVMNGFRAELFDRILGLNGHAVVQGYGGRLEGWPQVLADAKALPGVTSAIPMIEQPLMGSYGGRVEGVIVRGLRLNDLRANPTIADNITGGSLADLQVGAGTVAIGARLAEQLGVRVGEQISLINPAGQSTPFGTVPRIVAYRVAAVFEVGVYDYDKAFVIMPLEDAQTLMRLDDAVGMIEVVTADPDDVKRTLEPLRQKLAGIAVINDWQASNSALFSALVVEQTVMFWVLSIIIVVAVFNILSSLIMLVRAKTRDIAILRTMGASRAAIMRVFVTVGTSIGAAGVAAGLAL
ncbi:ABC transporter permease, partial [Sandarakinorhabdus sp.]|uniref:ABC transporter permease n=1 Tax=Sandarakinorhabdus sp. TaxID=1916663 RepID=UPI003340C6C3